MALPIDCQTCCGFLASLSVCPIEGLYHLPGIPFILRTYQKSSLFFPDFLYFDQRLSFYFNPIQLSDQSGSNENLRLSHTFGQTDTLEASDELAK
jgi:hypothetical protein